MKYLITGLGNIGPEYHETRHNIGFMAVDALAQAQGVDFVDGRYGFTSRFYPERTSNNIIEAINLHEFKWECSTLLDTKRKHSLGKLISDSR